MNPSVRRITSLLLGLSAASALQAAPPPAAAPAGVAATASQPPPHRSTAVRGGPARGVRKAPPGRDRRGVAGGSLVTIGRANAEARDWPSPAAYVNSTLFYDFEPGRIYTVQASPQFLTALALRPGENLISKAAGDTVRWVIGETHAGAGATEQVMVFVKPLRPGLRTNLILTTDQRVYLVDIRSELGPTYTSMVTWTYAQEDAKTLAAARSAAGVARGVADVGLDHLDFDYRIEPTKGRGPRWTPVRVFDDGTRTFIAFPADLATSEAPPLFLVGPKGQAELVNYRVDGRYYVVDRLFDLAELRLGERPQTIVRLRRLARQP